MLPMVMVGAAGLGLGAVLVMRASGKSITATTRLPLGTLMAVAAWSLWLWMQAAPGFPAG
jgi:leader peptidase (prepilin peptidase) / N-methyltransferase